MLAIVMSGYIGIAHSQQCKRSNPALDIINNYLLDAISMTPVKHKVIMLLAKSCLMYKAYCHQLC